jgi:2-dehydropantoate 2-reductase
MNHWHVLGAGSMGCLFAAHLTAAGCKVTLLLRKSTDGDPTRIRVDSADGTREVPIKIESCDSGSVIEHLLVATKAQDVVTAVSSVRHRLSADCPIILAANGMGYLEPLAEQLSGQVLYCCITTEGAYRLAPLHIRHAGTGVTRIGSPDQPPQADWLSDWQKSSLDCRWQPDIHLALWHKLAINCAINPLTAIHGCLNGVLASDPLLSSEVEQLCQEIATVSAAAGFVDTAASVAREVATVIAATAENRSSMLQDAQANRTTEIDYITGYLLQTAKDLNIPIPHNQQLFDKVKSLGA